MPNEPILLSTSLQLFSSCRWLLHPLPLDQSRTGCATGKVDGRPLLRLPHLDVQAATGASPPVSGRDATPMDFEAIASLPLIRNARVKPYCRAGEAPHRTISRSRSHTVASDPPATCKPPCCRVHESDRDPPAIQAGLLPAVFSSQAVQRCQTAASCGRRRTPGASPEEEWRRLHADLGF